MKYIFDMEGTMIGTLEKLQVYMVKGNELAEEILNKIKAVLADDDLISPSDKLWEIITVAVPKLRIEEEIRVVFRKTGNLLARHLLCRQNLLFQLWVNLMEMDGVRNRLRGAKMDEVIYWKGALSVMNDIHDAAFLINHNSYLGEPDYPVDPQEFLSYWVALAEALFAYFFKKKKEDLWANEKKLHSLMLKAAAGLPSVKVILEGKKKIPTIMDDLGLRDWIWIKVRESKKDPIRAHLAVDRLLIDHLATLGYERAAAAIRERITPVNKLQFRK